jgi:hypothetical protein
MPLKPHKLSEVIGALWPQWVGQYGLVTGPSSMGIVDANAEDLALVRTTVLYTTHHATRDLLLLLMCTSL